MIIMEQKLGFGLLIIINKAMVFPAAIAPAIVVDGPPLPPWIMVRSSLAKLELRVEKFPPSKPVAHAVRVGSWAC